MWTILKSDSAASSKLALTRPVQRIAAVVMQSQVDQFLFQLINRSIIEGTGDFLQEKFREFIPCAMDQYSRIACR
jgi:hypothetical protein